MATLKPAIFTPNNPTAPRICPELACEIGLNESMILLQIEFWIRLSGTLRDDGKYWIYESVTDFRGVFPFWSRMTINRAIHSLEDKGLIHVGCFNKLKYDRTRWFALNLEGVTKLETVRLGDTWLYQNDTTPYQNGTCPVQNDTTIPDLSSDLSTEKTSDAPVGAVSPEQGAADDIESFHNGDVPKIRPPKPKTPAKKRDVVEDIVQLAAQRNADPLWWLKPGTPCGDHDYLEPYQAFCIVIDRDPSTVGQRKTEKWLGQFGKIAVVSPADNGTEAVVIQPDVMAQAIQEIRGNWAFAHKKWTTPFSKGFADLVEHTASQLATGQITVGDNGKTASQSLGESGYNAKEIAKWAETQAP